jgi:sec-independent protein translocase protein TatB
MFDIGWGELVVIAVVALVVIGPKELPTVLRTIGEWMTKIRRMAAEFQGQFQDAMREAELAELKKEVESAADFTSGLNPLESARREIEGAFDAKPTPPAPNAEPAAAAFADGAVTAPPAAAADTPAPSDSVPLTPEASPPPHSGTPEGGRAA